MKTTLWTLTLTALVSACVSTSAFADGRHPGSLLLYPMYDSRDGIMSTLTVTNTNPDTSYNSESGYAKGSIDVEFIYIDGVDCHEFNRTERLTPNDTLSVIVGTHNAESNLGYVYVFAKDIKTGVPVTWNWLIGNMTAFDGIETLQYGINPFMFDGMTPEGTSTDVDGDGILDLDGVEYEGVADKLLFPRFFAQGEIFSSVLVLVNLTGGAAFTTTLDLLVYNDNEQVFSAEYTFTCWASLCIREMTGAFMQDFLENTDHDVEEIVGLSWLESGWFELDGGMASSTAASIEDPAFVGVLLEFAGPFGASDLPFEIGVQTNGDLLPRSVHGDS